MRERVLERQRLAAERNLVVVVRERAVDGVAQEDDQARVRNERGNAFRRERVEDVARARLADERTARAQRVREVAAVPGRAARVVAVEEADLLPGRPGDVRVPAEIRIERGRPCLLRADDQEVRQRPRKRGRLSVRPDGVACDDAKRRRNARDEPGVQPGHSARSGEHRRDDEKSTAPHVRSLAAAADMRGCGFELLDVEARRKSQAREAGEIFDGMRPGGLEPPTRGLEGRCSIQLSYGRQRAA